MEVWAGGAGKVMGDSMLLAAAQLPILRLGSSGSLCWRAPLLAAEARGRAVHVEGLQKSLQGCCVLISTAPSCLWQL